MEADAPLPVDSDAVGIGAIALQFLQPVSRRDPEITQRIGSVKDEELAQGHPLGSLVELPGRLSLPDALGVLVFEGPEHGSQI